MDRTTFNTPCECRSAAGHVTRAILAAAACVLGAVRVDAADVTWSGTTAASAWLTTSNWSTGAVPTTNDVAVFQNAGSATIAGINMGTLSGSYGLQAIVVDSTRTRALTIGNSSATSGTLNLLGGTVTGSSNVILRNASGSLLTLQDNDSGTGKTMRVALGNATDNVILLDGTGGITISSVIQGSGRNLTLTGTAAASATNVLTLSAANTYSGTTTIGRGAILASNNSALGTSTIVVASGAQLRLGSGVTINRPATIAGAGFSNSAGAIFANDTGGATATYSGNLTLSADGTRIGAQGQSGGGTLIVSGTIDSGANPYGLVVRNSGGDLGFVQLSAANTYLGSTWIAIGTLRLAGGNDRLPTTTNLRLGYTASGTWNAVLELNGRDQAVAGLSLDPATTVAGSNNIISNTSATLSTFTVNAGATSSTYNGILTGNLKLVKAGTNSLTFTGTGSNYGSGSTYTGGVDLNAGTLVAAHSASLGTGPLTINSGTLNMRSSVTTGLLTGSSGGTITGGTTGNLTLTLNSASSGTYAGDILNGSATSVILAKQGAGTLTLTGSSTFTGGANVTGGMLAFSSIADSGSASAIGASGVLRLNGGILSYVGTGDSSNRLVTFGVGSGTANQALTLRANGSGALNLTNTGSTPWGAGGTRTIVLGGSSTNLNTYGPLVADNTFNAITYAAAITKSDAGTWLLTGSNSYTGGTTITAGTLVVGNTTALGATTGSLAANAGTLDLNGRSITVGLLTGSSAATITSNTTGSVTLTASSASSGTFGGVIQSGSGTVGLTKSGAGTLTLAGVNTYTGPTQVNAGVLAIGAANALSNATAVTVGGGALDLGTFADTVGSVAITSGSIFGSGTLTAATYGLGGGTVAGNLGAGTLTVTANSALNGTANAAVVNLNSGTLTLGSAGRLTSAVVAVSGSSGGGINLGGDEAFGSLAGAANVALGASTLSVGGADTSTSYSGVISGAGGLTKTGAGALTVTVAQTYLGATTVSGGTLALSGAGAIGSSSGLSLTASGAVFDMSGASGNRTVAGLSGVAGSTVLLGANTLTASLATTGTFAGVIDGAGGLTKSGAGSLRLTGVGSYAGPTSVTGGSFIVDGSLASSALTVNPGASLLGTGTLGGATVIAGIHSPGNSPGIQTFSSGLEYASTGTLAWELYANSTASRGTNYDGVNLIGGALTIDPAATLQLDFGTTALGSTVDWDDAFWGSSQQWTIIDVSGGATWNGQPFFNLVIGNDALGRSLASVRPDSTFSITESGGDLVLVYAAVPEPGTLSLAGIGLLAAGWASARRRARRHAAA